MGSPTTPSAVSPAVPSSPPPSTAAPTSATTTAATAPTPATATTTSSTLQQHPDPAMDIDPAVSNQLVPMFPDYDAQILQAVFVSSNRNIEHAIESLLAMSSPEYNPPPQTSQADLDEQLARHLEQEEIQAAQLREQQHAWRAQHQQQQPHHPPPPQHQQPYPGPNQHQQPSSGSGTGDINIQEQFTKFAETGKKTFNSLFSLVKEKLKELDQPNTSSQQYGQPTAAPQNSHHADGPWTTFQPSPHPLPTSVTSPPATTPLSGSVNPPSGPVTTYHAPQNAPPLKTADAVTPAPAAPGASVPEPTATASLSTAAPTGIDLSKASFLAKNPQPLQERHDRDDDFTESPFDDPKR